MEYGTSGKILPPVFTKGQSSYYYFSDRQFKPKPKIGRTEGKKNPTLQLSRHCHLHILKL